MFCSIFHFEARNANIRQYQALLNRSLECEFCYISTESSLWVYTNQIVSGEDDWQEIAVARIPTEGRMYNRALRGLLKDGV